MGHIELHLHATCTERGRKLFPPDDHFSGPGRVRSLRAMREERFGRRRSIEIVTLRPSIHWGWPAKVGWLLGVGNFPPDRQTCHPGDCECPYHEVAQQQALAASSRLRWQLARA